MTGMVLAAGRGERMRPLSHRLAKPALPVLNRPLVSFALDLFRRAGVKRAAVNTHHLPATIEAALEQWTPPGMRIERFHEERLLGTAGGVKNAESTLAGGPFLLSNGDFVLDVDPQEVLAAHRRSGAAATMVLLPYQEHSGYAPVEAIDGRVVRIAGHPEWDAPAGERYIFAGLHVVEPSVLARIPAGEPMEINRQVYPSLLTAGETIAAHVVDTTWLEFGTPGEYLRRSLHLLDPVFGALLERVGVVVQGKAPNAFLTGSDASVHPTVSLRAGVVLGDRVSVGRDAKIRRSIVWNDASVGYGCDVSDSILGSGVILPPNSRFHHRIVLARGEDLPQDAGGERQGDLIHFRL